MGIVLSPDHPLSIEEAKWNKPYRFEAFPKMLYRARKRQDGISSVGETQDSVCGGQSGAAELFSKSCQLIVKDEREETRAKEQGYRETQAEALEHFEQLEIARSNDAANRHFSDRLMSEPARLEAAQVDAASFEHVAAIPEKKRGRRKNADA